MQKQYRNDFYLGRNSSTKVMMCTTIKKAQKTVDPFRKLLLLILN